MQMFCFFCAPLTEKQSRLFFFRNITPDREETMIQHGLRQRSYFFVQMGPSDLVVQTSLWKRSLFLFHRLARTQHLISSFSIGPPPVCSPGIYSGELFGRGAGSAAGKQQKYLPPPHHAPILCSPSSMQSHLLKAYPRHPRQGPIRNTLVQPRGDGARQALLSGGCTRPRWGVGLGPGSEIRSGSDAIGHLRSETKGWNNVTWCDLWENYIVKLWSHIGKEKFFSQQLLLMMPTCKRELWTK